MIVFYIFTENCYKRVEKETKLIKEKILENLGTKPIDKDVVVLYEGENLPEKVNIVLLCTHI